MLKYIIFSSVLYLSFEAVKSSSLSRNVDIAEYKQDLLELTLEKLIEKSLVKQESEGSYHQKRQNVADCTDKKFDIVFVIDSSLSIGTQNFNTMKNFVSNVAGQFDIGPDKTRIGLTLFGNTASDVFYLNSHDTLQDVQAAIQGASYSGGLTFIHQGLVSVQDNQFTPTNGDRDGIINIVIALTDGRFSDNVTAQDEADKLRASDTKIMSIGVGCAIDENQIKDLSSLPQTEGQDYFLATDFTKLEQEVSTALATAVCTIPDCGTLPPPEFGSISFTHTLENGKATYTCDLGTGIMNGAPVRKCQADGQWSGQVPVCIDCLEKPMDIVFVVDASGSVGSLNFQVMTNFINGVIGKLNIAPDKTKVGYVRFANSATSIFSLDEYTTKADLQSAVSAVSYTAGTTNMASALVEMRDVQFTLAQGDRAGAVDVAIVLSDGKFNNPTTALSEALAAQQNGIQMVAIGITSGVVESEIKGISSPPNKKGQNYFLAENFQSLETQLIESLPHQVCQAWSEEK